MALISVIVPVYKVEPYLKRCVDSILGQSFTDFRLILVDDGSPDDCGAICDLYASQDARIKVIHQKNQGLSAARNAGIDCVLSDKDCRWITFIDSDDWVLPQYLEYLLLASRKSETEISVCRWGRVDGNDPPEETEGLRICTLKPEELLCADRGTGIVAWAKLYAIRLFQETRFPVGRLHEDEFTTYRVLFETDRVAFVDNVLYCYYVNPNSITERSWTPRRTDSIDALYQQCVFFHKNGYLKAEKQTAGLLLDYSLTALSHLQWEFPDEKNRIKNARKRLRWGIRRYGKVLRLRQREDLRTLRRYAYPLLYKTEKRLRRLLNG